MKKPFTILFIYLVLFIACSYDNTLYLGNPNDDPIVVIFRSEYASYTDNSYYYVYCDNIKLAIIGKNDFFGVRVNPGQHNFRAGNARVKTINAESGKLYHIRFTNRSCYGTSTTNFNTFDRQPSNYFSLLKIKTEQFPYKGHWSSTTIPVVNLKTVKKYQQ